MNSYHLKYIALVTMIIDHAGCIFRSCLSPTTYTLMRVIGRMAFPIYAFLLVEGFYHTRNQQKYLSRLLIFAVLSEIPFDLVMNGTYGMGIKHVMNWSHQNVFFSLSLGFAAMMMLSYYKYSTSMIIFTILTFTYLGDFIKCDYRSIGVITIILFYYAKERNLDCFKPWCYLILQLPLVFAYINLPIQTACLATAVPMTFYNGEKGRGSKYFFYIAYPAHFLLLFGAKILWESL